MCGVAAILARPGENVSLSLCERFDRAMVHRGPDASGAAFYHRDGCDAPREAATLALLHRRLSIIDLDPRANQPMASADGRYALVYNGEIYNYLELRRELEGAGHVFRTSSDTEVLIAAYAAWGDACLHRFTGMFAFVLLDRERRELVLARDPFGIKPLFWAMAQGAFAAASEIGPLLELPGVGRRIDAKRACLYLTVGETDAGDRTMFADVRSIPAGHVARVSLDRPEPPRSARYWSPTIAIRERSAETAAREVREAMLASVALHLRSDVPVGIALSGGIDSSAILACARHVGGPSTTLRSYSFVAADSDVDESPYIDIAAQAAGAEQHRVRVDPADVVADIDRLIAVQGEPFGSLSMYAQHRVMQLAAQDGIKVILDGQGADELFAGYRPYLARRLSELLRRFDVVEAVSLAKAMRTLPGTGGALFAQALEPAVPRALKAWGRRLVGRPICAPWIDAGWFAARDAFAARADLAFGPDFLHESLIQSATETVLPALLRYGDRNSMAFSIESRVPFLTTALADLAYSMPSRHLVDGNATSKSVLRAAMRGLVPDAILDRRDKVAFATPDRLWARALQPWFREVLSSQRARSIPWLKPDVALAALDKRAGGGAAFGFDIWRAVNVVRWIETFDVQFA